jgi:hypothetical protein
MASIESAGARWELWSMDGPSPVLIAEATGSEAVFTFGTLGNHSLRLYASDAALNNATAQMRVYVGERPDNGDDEIDRATPYALIAMVIAAIFIALVILSVTILVLRKRSREIVEEEWVDEDEEELDEPDDEDGFEDWGDWEQ